ncbi:transposase [Chitinivorax sp. B]|uniref:transposase n=1 Tax=Chitinivorax sp. B TaxID=2502235 RepID=UPI0010F5E388|nr:transposase [Chitinivorax sp. B]
MKTFDVKFKRKVVREYLSGKGGYKILAAKFDITRVSSSWKCYTALLLKAGAPKK